MRLVINGLILLDTFYLLVIFIETEPAGTFKVYCDDVEVWDRKKDDVGFPEMKELKQIIRDVAVPGLDLGHSDKKKKHA